jgi:bifunctional enzyme CysN/CysC
MTLRPQTRLTLKIVVVGHVDHGKSTVVGRLIFETDSLPEGKFESIQAMSARRGMPFEWAFLLDALQAERDQGVTIDTTQIRFRTPTREFVLIDAPGHKEFLKNMVTGAANAEAALIVVDAAAGVEEQTRRHAYLLHLLGLRRVVGVVNKMDLVGRSAERFEAVRCELVSHLTALGLDSSEITVVPVSARDGDNIAVPSGNMRWYHGPTLLATLDALPLPIVSADLPLRFAIQDVYKFDERRIIAGRLESGRLRVGDTLLFSPTDKTAGVASIEAWNAAQPVKSAGAVESIGVTLDEGIFVERGEVASHQTLPPMLTNVFRARLFWLGRKLVRPGNSYVLKLLTSRVEARIEKIERVIDTGDLSARTADAVERNEIAEVIMRTRGTISVDPFATNPRTGRFVLVEDFKIVGGGIIDMQGFRDLREPVATKSTNITRTEPRVSLAERWRANGHRSGILWLTGLSGSGKTTLAQELERYLFRKGFHTIVLDGDNLRYGLNSDLGFSATDRSENIRRAGEVGALFARAGILVIMAFISPYRMDRDCIREGHPDLFHEVYLAATVEQCEQRDPKGLYAKARAGEIKNFTGISAPYEPPLAADLIIDTGRETVEQSLAILIDYVDRHFGPGRDDEAS